MEEGSACLGAMIVKTLTVAVMHNGNGRKHQEDACLVTGSILSGFEYDQLEIGSENIHESDMGNIPGNQVSELDSTIERRSGSSENIQLFAVADGMGGHNIGDLAAKTALQTLKDDVDLYIRSIGKKVIDFAELADIASEDIDRCVRQQLVAWQGMPVGTTLSWLLIYNDSAYTMSIGHSRIYLFRQNKLYCVTRDHRTPENGSRPDLYYGFRAEESRIIPDNLNRLPLQKGDVLLLTTDGITNVLSDETIESVLSSPQAYVNQVHRLKDLALASGSRDNMCIAAVRVQAVEAVEGKAEIGRSKEIEKQDGTRWISRFLDRFKS